ncbi:efflux RND transporter periplasmic adaptor subunit [Azospirillum doebereinerae]|uniref:Efflux RND transporter periplasmic adaptor subunit n=1 Tax=Azospirillum doebereinerae TaxID=92933 RepID=A0A433J689_9PROT|nr:efflux RND transporter periplasmic adaptor subunit [Azospirillum doebereinerae]MCG5240574.1 efflux RND transporter periplasmic adaptor subunit [Azospirillum doebereinerae]RUQ68460.1 efflux RND transporter periplasmic adaptor subunit [Azospirillum doebereinerae]
MSKANRMTALAATALLGLALAGCQKQQGQASAQPAAPPPVEVGVATIEPKPLPVIAELPGRTTAYRVAEVRPQVNGIILKRMFREGADVKAGDQLYQIDPATYQAALASAQADLQKAEANMQAARNKAARYGDLIKNSVVSRQDFDDVNALLKQNEAQVASAKAAVDLARINLDYTKVFAPISGRIGKSAVTEGALVMANQATVLATIQQLDPLFVDVTQTAAELMRLRQDLASGRIQSPDQGKAAVTLFLNNGGAPYSGKGELQFSDVTVDQGTSSVQLRAVFPNPNLSLLPGLFVRARIEQGVVEGAITVPQAALARRPDGGAYVWVVGDDNKVSQRSVTTERAIGSVWLVSDGLKTGEKIVVEGLQKIKPGAEVKTVPTRVASAALPQAPLPQAR